MSNERGTLPTLRQSQLPCTVSPIIYTHHHNLALLSLKTLIVPQKVGG